jgi:hypothetical protein
MRRIHSIFTTQWHGTQCPYRNFQSQCPSKFSTLKKMPLIYAYIRGILHIYTHMCVCVFVCVCVYTLYMLYYTHTHTHTHTHMHIHTYTHTYIYHLLIHDVAANSKHGRGSNLKACGLLRRRRLIRLRHLDRALFRASEPIGRGDPGTARAKWLHLEAEAKRVRRFLKN